MSSEAIPPQERATYLIEPKDRLRTRRRTGLETVKLKVAHVVGDHCRPEVGLLPSQAHVSERQTVNVPAVETVGRQRSKHVGFRVGGRRLAHVETRSFFFSTLERHINIVQAHVLDMMARQTGDGAGAESSGGDQILDGDVAKRSRRGRL